MDWLSSLLQALLGENPLVILAVVVLSFVYLIHRLGVRVLKTIERVAKAGERQ